MVLNFQEKKLENENLQINSQKRKISIITVHSFTGKKQRRCFLKSGHKN